MILLATEFFKFFSQCLRDSVVQKMDLRNTLEAELLLQVQLLQMLDISCCKRKSIPHIVLK